MDGGQRSADPGCKEPLGLTLEDRKRPDGATLFPWAQGKPLAWDVTAPNIFAPPHLPSTSLIAGAAADKAAVSKTAKYEKLRGIHLFFQWQPRQEDPGGTSDGTYTRNWKKIDHRRVEPVENVISLPAHFHNHPER